MKMYLTCAMAMSALTAGTATAAVTVFEKENFTYKLGADLQIQLLQDSGVDEDLDVNYDDGELKNHFEYDLGNGLMGFGQLDLEIAKDSGVSREEAYVGLAKDNMSFFVGNSDYVTDGFGVEKNIDVVDVGGDVFPLDNSDDLLGFSFSGEQFEFALSHDLEVDDDTSSTDLILFTEIQGFELALAFQSASNLVIDTAAGDVLSDAETFGISAGYGFGNYGVALAYSVADADEAPDTISNIHVVGSAKVTANTEINLGYDIVDVGDDNAAQLGLADTDSWYLNAIYKFPNATGFSTFAEIGQTDVDGVDDIDAGFLAGLRLQF